MSEDEWIEDTVREYEHQGLEPKVLHHENQYGSFVMVVGEMKDDHDQRPKKDR